jgi:DNA-binding response OmpR family regulator
MHESSADRAVAPAIVCLEPNLFFAPRLQDVIRRQGGTPVVVETPESFVAAIDAHDPVLALLDLAAEGDWADAIRRCKLRPHTSHVPILPSAATSMPDACAQPARPVPTTPGRAAE